MLRENCRRDTSAEALDPICSLGAAFSMLRTASGALQPPFWMTLERWEHVGPGMALQGTLGTPSWPWNGRFRAPCTAKLALERRFGNFKAFRFFPGPKL